MDLSSGRRVMITIMSLTIEQAGTPDGSGDGPSFAIRAEGVSVFHGTRPAVTGATFEVPAGSSLAVIGPNGSGKSSLLGAVAGLHDVRSGVLGVPARARRGGVALVLQDTDVDRSLPLTVHETVHMARYPHLGLLRRRTPADRDAVTDSLERVGMTDRRWSQLSELSGGQRQRVLVAQGLAQQGDLLLLDEPLTGLDVLSARTIREVMEAERASGRTVVFSTHDLPDAAVADKVLLIATHQVAFGPPAEVLSEGPLSEAFGGSILHFGDGGILLDDPHHFHGDGHHDR